jgi:hypothetical protein
MFRQGPLPALIHGLLDYLVGVVLLAGPFVLDFEDDAAIATSIGAGVLLLVLASASDLPTSFVRSVPRALHAIFDYVIAIAILVAPFVLGFTDDDSATAFLVAMAVVQIMQTIATRFLRPKDQPRPTA